MYTLDYDVSSFNESSRDVDFVEIVDLSRNFGSYNHNSTHAGSLQAAPGFAVVLIVIMIGAVLVIIGIIKERSSRFSYCLDNCICCCRGTQPPASIRNWSEDTVTSQYYPRVHPRSRYASDLPVFTLSHTRVAPPVKPEKIVVDDPPPPYESLTFDRAVLAPFNAECNQNTTASS